jgi:hypothetical protein
VYEVPFIINEPDMSTLPVNWCKSSGVLPNIVDPLCDNVWTFITEDDITNVLAVIVPATTKLFDKFRFKNVGESVLLNIIWFI